MDNIEILINEIKELNSTLKGGNPISRTEMNRLYDPWEVNQIKEQNNLLEKVVEVLKRIESKLDKISKKD